MERIDRNQKNYYNIYIYIEIYRETGVKVEYTKVLKYICIYVKYFKYKELLMMYKGSS